MDHLPRLTRPAKGAALMLVGLLLFLYVTNIITVGLQLIFFLVSILLIAYGFVEMDGYNKMKRLLNKRR